MSELSEDFDAYVHELTKRNRFALGVLITAAGIALVLLCVSLGLFAFQDNIVMAAIDAEEQSITARLAKLVLNSEAMNALNLANVCANLAVAAAIRIWYTRQDKMTTLLTHAMVLEGENETAIRVLLNKKLRR